MNIDSTKTCFSCALQKVCMALIWFQTMVWSFLLVGSAGLSLYCWFENPEPWTAMGRIWTVAGEVTLAALLVGLLLNLLSGLARKARRLT